MVNPVLVNAGSMNVGGDYGTGAMAQGLNDFAQRRKDNSAAALGLVQENNEVIKKRYVNSQINNLLDMAPNVEGADDGKGGVYGSNESPDAYSLRVKQKMGEIADIDPMVALGLSQKITEPYRTQTNADRLFNQNVTEHNDAQTYRTNTLNESSRHNKAVEGNNSVRNTETKRHNSVMEIPTDIREANQAGYPTGERVTAGKDGVMGTDDDIVKKYLTKEDFALYQEDKARASMSNRVQSDETKADLISKAAKRFEDSLNEDQFEMYNKLNPTQKQNVLKRYFKTGVIPYSGDTKSWYQGSNAGFDSSPIVVDETLETEYQDIPDGASDNNDGTFTYGGKVYKKKAK